MLKKIRLLAISLSLILILSGCASSMTASTTAAAAATTNAGAKSDEAMPQASTTAGSASSDAGGDAVIIDPGNVADSGKKIIYTVNMTIEAADARKAINDISSTAAQMGGYVSDSSYDKNEESVTGTITVRIPPDKLKEFTEHVGTVGEVKSSSMGSQDVTAAYTDISSRLTNAEAQEAQLLAIMAKAVKIEDILSVRAELNTVQQEIEELKGQIRLMDNQVGYSTVSIYVTQTPSAPVSPEAEKNSGLLARWSFDYIWQSVQKGFSNSVSFTVNALGVIFIALSYLLIPAVVIGIAVIIIVVLVKRSKKKKGQKKPSEKTGITQ